MCYNGIVEKYITGLVRTKQVLNNPFFKYSVQAPFGGVF